jgi:hypothetical protein
VTALAVSVTGAAFFVTSGTVVVAIDISLALKLSDYSKCRFRHNCPSGNRWLCGRPAYWMLAAGGKSHSSPLVTDSGQRD